MKALFITCSIIAILYLGYQSQIWDYFIPAHQVENNDETNTTGSIPSDSINKDTFSTTLATRDLPEIIALNERIDILNKKIDDLERAQQQSFLDRDTLNNKTTSLSASQEQKQKQESDTSDLDLAAQTDEKLQSEQIKRLNQQALLRDLSQKLELTALSSLSN
ncbi:hypothetical protein [Glaciecola petra]|uniref:Uncharacterized protein n=1 Tax=Glaciecola petra TaxID=3075602 RepID=A0ABU2ZN55_9ALTE|nr:hypothetical protein [Aestuariibacter sp. P117]MDT0594061.1 hypothetical protein [Aestuariibacter sp. P117]